MPLFQLCKGKDGLQLGVGDLYTKSRHSGAAALGKHTRKAGEETTQKVNSNKEDKWESTVRRTSPSPKTVIFRQQRRQRRRHFFPSF